MRESLIHLIRPACPAAAAMACCVALAFAAAPAAASEAIQSTETVSSFKHRRLDLAVDTDRFTAQLEKLLGRFNTSGADVLIADPELASTRYRAMEGEQGLMLFGSIRHGELMNLAGGPRKGKRYNVGNPLVAVQMMKHDFRAGLYAPLSILVYESKIGHTIVEYDTPGSIFGQFRNSDIDQVAASLEEKLDRLIRKAAAAAAQP